MKACLETVTCIVGCAIATNAVIGEQVYRQVDIWKH